MTFTGNFTYFLLILARMSACVFFNQILGRGNIPAIFKTALSLFLAYTVYTVVPPENAVVIDTIIEFILAVIKEIFIGFLLGYIMSMFFSTVVISGEIIGMQTGLSMSQIYDPSSNVSMGIMGSFLNIILVLIFFSANGHITLIKIFITSCKLIEVGKFAIPKELYYDTVKMFSQILILALKLSMPVMAIEIILEAGMGILVKAIPQIQIFSVNIQLKIMLGLILTILLVPVYATFIDNTITLMFETMQNSLTSLMTQ